MSDLRQIEELLAARFHPRSLRGEPCIVRTRIPVWALEPSRRLGISEEELLRSYPALRAEDLVKLGYVRCIARNRKPDSREEEA